MRRKEFWISLVILVAGVFLIDYTSTAEVSVSRARFASFPKQILGMTSEGRPLSASVLRELGLTDYLSRQYVSKDRLSANLYIGFYESQRTGATYHSPKNCLPGSGWQMIDTGTVEIATPKGPAAVNEIVIQKATDKQVVVYWYHDRGRVIASEYAAKIYMVWDAATRHRTDGALVRVIVPVSGGDVQAARTAARTFATEVMGLLPKYLPG